MFAARWVPRKLWKETHVARLLRLLVGRSRRQEAALSLCSEIGA